MFNPASNELLGLRAVPTLQLEAAKGAKLRTGDPREPEDDEVEGLRVNEAAQQKVRAEMAAKEAVMALRAKPDSEAAKVQRVLDGWGWGRVVGCLSADVLWRLRSHRVGAALALSSYVITRAGGRGGGGMIAMLHCSVRSCARLLAC
jgi:hypothetical protein